MQPIVSSSPVAAPIEAPVDCKEEFVLLKKFDRGAIRNEKDRKQRDR